MRGKAQVVIGAKVDYLFSGADFDDGILRSRDDSLLLI
jgi:hypothetical protein